MGKQQKHIILIAGHKGSGKDTLADFLVKRVPTLDTKKSGEQGIEKLWFATSLKLICCKLMNAFYNSDEDYFNLERLSCPKFKETKIPKYEFNRKSLVPRHVLQYVGTDILRTLISEDVFARATVKRIRSDDNKTTRPQHYIISDFRFMNEYSTIMQEFGDEYKITVIRVYRSLIDNQTFSHQSETEMDTPEFKKLVDFTFVNDNSFTEIEAFADYICKRLHILPRNYNQLIANLKKE